MIERIIDAMQTITIYGIALIGVVLGLIILIGVCQLIFSKEGTS